MIGNEEGHSLVEVIIGIALLVIITIVSMQIVIAGFRIQKNLESMAMAMPTAETLLSEMVAQGSYETYEGEYYQDFLIHEVKEIWKSRDISYLEVTLEHKTTKFEYTARRYLQHLIE